MSKKRWKSILKEQEIVLIFGIIDLLMDILFYFRLRDIILNNGFNSVSQHIKINFNVAFQMAQSIGYEEVLKECLIGTLLFGLLIYLVCCSLCRYLFETIIVVYLSNIILTIMLVKYLMLIWIIAIGGALYSAAHSESIS